MEAFPFLLLVVKTISIWSELETRLTLVRATINHVEQGNAVQF